MPKWRNWQTRQTQNLLPVTRRGGSIPPFGTNLRSRLLTECESYGWQANPARLSTVAATAKVDCIHSSRGHSSRGTPDRAGREYE